MFERFTDRARRVLVLSQEYARDHKHSFIGTEHLLYGLASEGLGGEHGVAASVLLDLNVTPDGISAKIEEIVGDGASEFSGNPPFTPRAKKVLELGLREALQLGHSYIGTEHLLMGLEREGEGSGAVILAGLGVIPGDARKAVLAKIKGQEPSPQPTPESTEIFSQVYWIETKRESRGNYQTVTLGSGSNSTAEVRVSKEVFDGLTVGQRVLLHFDVIVE